MREKAPNFLNDDGSASMATAFMTSHHGFRRDLAQFRNALRRVTEGDTSRTPALREEWEKFRGTLHGHHTVEDQGMFPSMKAEHPALAEVIDGLVDEHRRIDPILEAGDRAFAGLPGTVAGAASTVAELSSILDAHLAKEEKHLVPLIREAKQFPAPGTEAEIAMYADGFAWSSHGVAPEVLERLYEIVPEPVRARLPAARASYEARCERVWGTAKAGASKTPVPDWI